MDFYYMPASPACRSAHMVAEAVGAELNLKFINLATRDQMKPEYIKINPQHTIPTLVDGDITLCESRAICLYLIEKFGKKEYYPDCYKTRALINQRLFLDMGLFKKFIDYQFPQAIEKKPADPEKYKAAHEGLAIFNTLLEGQKYVVGDSLTVADFCLVSSVSSMEAVDFGLEKYPNIIKWLNLCKETIPTYDVNQKGVDDFQKIFKV